MKPIIVYNEYMLIKKKGGTQWVVFRSLKGSPYESKSSVPSFFSWPGVKQFIPPGIKSGHVPTQVQIKRNN